MKQKSWIAAFIAAVLGTMMFAAPAFAGGGDGDSDPTCTPSPGSPEIPATYKEIPNPDYVPATEGTPGVPGVPAVPGVWANFQPNDEQATFTGPPSYPSDERGSWNSHGDLPPGQAGPDGVYSQGNPDKGGNWFYRKAGTPGVDEIPAVPGTPAVGEPTITVIDTPAVPAVPAVTCEEEPDPTPTEDKKVYVCKYVGTPGVDERLQTGQNPIEVSVNSIENNKWDGTVPGYFSDAQGRSYVLGYVPMDPEPTAEDCPTGEQLIEVEPSVEVHDLCGVEDDWFIYGDEVGITYSYDGDRFLTVTAETGYVIVLSEGSPFTLDEEGTATWDGYAAFTDVPCTEQPEPLVEVTYTDWVDGVWACGDTEVTQTRTKITTTTPYVLVDEEYVLDTENAVVVEEQEEQSRLLTREELADCPLTPGNITSVCVGDIPFLSYAVTPPEGYIPESANPVTITFSNGTNSYTVPGTFPLTGTVLWPGANVNPPQWPGWTLDGTATTDDPARFGWTRTGVTVTFEINPTYSTVVAYPAATSTCANPPAKAIPTVTTVAHVNGVAYPTSSFYQLAATGSEGVLSMAALAAVLIVIGGTATVLAVRRNK